MGGGGTQDLVSYLLYVLRQEGTPNLNDGGEILLR